MKKMCRLNCEEFVILDNGIVILGHDLGDGPIYSEHPDKDEKNEIAALEEA